MSETRTIRVGALARVEGEGALHVVLEGRRVAELRLEIYEPPRFFEEFARGRRADEIPDLLARICGICPVAYQMSSVHAIESAFGLTPDPQVRALRRLYYAGEWIESHLLHMMFLNAPDYLGLDDAFEIARRDRAQVERALALRKLGNRILILLGGRSVNPVGVRIGGFHRLPEPGALRALGDELRRARGEAEALLRWFEQLPVPRRAQPVELVALRHPSEYPMNEGVLVSSRDLRVDPAEFDAAFCEEPVPHSTALHCHIRDGRRTYMVGPLARVRLNSDRLSPTAGAAYQRLGERFAAADPAASVFARGIEVLQAIDEALAVIDSYRPPAAAVPSWSPRAGTGHGATEAPRGVLYIQIRSDAAGLVEQIRIVPPTSQNQAQIESDLRGLVSEMLESPDDQIRRRCEAAIRDYDPCISCSTHFLELELERRPGRCGSA